MLGLKQVTGGQELSEQCKIDRHNKVGQQAFV